MEHTALLIRLLISRVKGGSTLLPFPQDTDFQIVTSYPESGSFLEWWFWLNGTLCPSHSGTESKSPLFPLFPQQSPFARNQDVGRQSRNLP